MAYGFQQFDSNGNVVVDSSSPFRRLTQVWDQVTITVGAPGNAYANSKTVYLPQVTSADDLKNKCGMNADMDLLTKVTIGCGPSIYNADSATVSGSDESEDSDKNIFSEEEGDMMFKNISQ